MTKWQRRRCQKNIQIIPLCHSTHQPCSRWIQIFWLRTSEVLHLGLTNILFTLCRSSSVRPYACAYGSTLSTNPESSHAMYYTAHELQEHITLAHPDIAGTHLPMFRCGIAGCGQSWKVHI